MFNRFALRDAREKLGLTQLQLANAAGIDRSRLAGIEGDFVVPNGREAAAINAGLLTLARGLIKSAEDILSGEVEIRIRQPRPMSRPGR
jgi:transcriptional regulator with XRE-family HTH domain